MIVQKFGGTSVKDKEAMERVLNIVATNRNKQPFVVLSACAGVTDRLLQLAHMAAVDVDTECRNLFLDVLNRHVHLAEEIIINPILKKQAVERVNNLCRDLNNLLEGIALLRECTDRSMDAAASFGELLSSSIFEVACRERRLNSEFIDARTIIITDSNFGQAAINWEKLSRNIKNKLDPLLKENKIIVTQGFIGSDESGKTTTLGRGGSDYSASVFGSETGAREIQIWTDVPGVLSADPKKVPNARTITQMSFAEVREMSFFGAKVLHPDTIKPAVEKKIPVRVLDSANPEHPGTLILDKSDDKDPELRAIVLVENCILCHCEIPYHENSQSFFLKMLKSLVKTGAKILSSLCTENNCQVLLDSRVPIPDDVFQTIISTYKLEIENMSLICISGINLLYPDYNVNQKIMQIAEIVNSFKPTGTIFGASSVSILVTIPVQFGDQALQEIHKIING